MRTYVRTFLLNIVASSCAPALRKVPFTFADIANKTKSSRGDWNVVDHAISVTLALAVAGILASPLMTRDTLCFHQQPVRPTAARGASRRGT